MDQVQPGGKRRYRPCHANEIISPQLKEPLQQDSIGQVNCLVLIIKEILVDMWTPLSIYSNQIICSFHLGANKEFSPCLTHDYKVGVAWNELMINKYSIISYNTYISKKIVHLLMIYQFISTNHYVCVNFFGYMYTIFYFIF